MNFFWDEHGSGGDTASGDWETRLDPGDAIAFAVEPGGRVRVVGPGEVADITLASRAAVVAVLPWAEGVRGGTRSVRTWVKVEVDGIVQGAWVSRAPAPVNPPQGVAGPNPSSANETGPDGSDPGRSPATDGGLDPTPHEADAGGVNRWISDGLARVEPPRDHAAGTSGGSRRMPRRRSPLDPTVGPQRQRLECHRCLCSVDSRARASSSEEGEGQADFVAMEARDHRLGNGTVRDPRARRQQQTDRTGTH